MAALLFHLYFIHICQVLQILLLLAIFLQFSHLIDLGIRSKPQIFPKSNL